MSLSVREKRPPGGCAGFLSQLVGWNRLLARKKQKHFPKKLLHKKLPGDRQPPVPKLLIAEENCGGFPTARKKPPAADDVGDGMRPAGLVARLMGLESMPAAGHENPRKAFHRPGNASSCSGKSKGKVSDGYYWVDGDLCLETGGSGKAAEPSRPPKLQKTGRGFSGRQTANAVGANAVDKSMLVSQSRRRQHKLPLPPTSPRSPSGGHRARLLQAASKILEPGMRPRAHSKFALTNAASSSSSFSSHCTAEQASDAALSWMAQAASDFNKASSSYDESLERKIKMEPLLVIDEQGRGRALPVEIKANTEGRVCDSVERKCDIQNDRDRCIVHIKGNDDTRRNKKPAVNGDVVARSKVSSQSIGRRFLNEQAGTEEFGAAARNQKSSALTKSGGSGGTSETERYAREKTWTRKRRPINNTHTNNFGALGEQCVRNHMINQRGKANMSKRPMNSGGLEREGRKKVGSDTIGGTKENNISSFAFSSPMKPSTKSPSYCKMVDKTRGKNEQRIDVSQREGLVLGAKSENISSRRMINVSGDELSKLLDQKISELNSFDREDSANSCASSERYMDTMLQELIPSLDIETPKSQQSGYSFFGGSTPTSNIRHGRADFSDYAIFNDHTPESCKNYLGDSKTGFSAANLICDVDQPSPTSILEASFSNDSCSVGSPNDHQDVPTERLKRTRVHYISRSTTAGSLTSAGGGKFLIGLISNHGKAELPRLDFDISDSPTSVNVGEKLTHQFFDSLNFGFLEAKLNCATGAISNIEVLFSSILSCDSKGALIFSLDSFLLDTLEAIVHALCVSSQGSVVLGEEKEGYQLGSFLFDCMIECLDSNYSRFCKTGYKTWSKLHSLLSKEWLIKEISKEIRGWREMAGKVLDNLVEKEFDYPVMKWTTCENKAFEIGMQIENNILQELVDEFIFDLW